MCLEVKVLAMENPSRREQNLFELLGLEVRPGAVEVGETYPIFGMITDLSSEVEGRVTAELNHNITAYISVEDSAKVDLLKQKAFETGIFVCRVLATNPRLEVECQAVIFGKNQAYQA